MLRVKLRSFLRKLALSCAGAAVLLAGLEFAARAAEPGPLTLFDNSPYDPHLTRRHVHKPDFRGAWDGSFYLTNSRGWRGPQFEPTYQPGELRVLALGDSCTFGKSVEELDTWPRQLEGLLRAAPAAPRSVLVGNLGVNGYSGAEYVSSFLEQGFALKPHIVVIGYNINDFPNVVKQTDFAVFQNRENLRSMVSSRWREKLGKLALFRWLRSRYYDSNRERDFARMEELAKTTTGEAQTSPERMALEEARLRELVIAARAVGAQVVMFLFPYESQVYLEQYARGPADAIEQLARNLEIEYVDMLEAFRAQARASDPPARLFNIGDRYHPNAQGYAIVAQELEKRIRERGWARLPQ